VWVRTFLNLAWDGLRLLLCGSAQSRLSGRGAGEKGEPLALQGPEHVEVSAVEGQDRTGRVALGEHDE
jgi:hypothetical protein